MEITKEPTTYEPPIERRKLPDFQEHKLALRGKLKQFKWHLAIFFGVLLTALLAYEVFMMLTTESTDDAFVSADVHTISSRIPGTVLNILVHDNQVVKKGDILVQLDPAIYNVEEKIAQANYMKAYKDLKRWDGTTLVEPLEKIQFNANKASELTAAAELEKAQLELQYTNVVAPASGKIGERTVETGEQIQPGQALMALVEQKPWVTANFRESQIANIHPGEKVDIQIDAIPDHEFTGHVNSISPGSGATFSLLPPDNATGNFTKIVQRIPVKIVFDADSVRGYQDRLVPGMSADVTVKVSGR